MRGAPLAEPEELPQLWQKPAFEHLLACLTNLRLEPPIWGLQISREDTLKKQQQQQRDAVDPREIISFLSCIIKSTLGWIDDDEKREQIWEEASKRLSERCGRTAMGEIIRKWPFESQEYEAFNLAIREPSLTGDSLGLKTWGSSYVLAQLLYVFSSGPLAHLFHTKKVVGTRPEPTEILELGSGTGLLGLAAACVWGASVVLTDLPDIMPNLIHNAELNRSTVEGRGGSIEAAALTWGGREGESDPRFTSGNRYQLIIVADPLYDDNHPLLLTSAIDAQLSLDADARVLVMIPQRDDTTKRLTDALRVAMAAQDRPLVCVEEDMVAGEDDWAEGDQDDSTQRCFWWGIFRRG
ncbi:putative methyltransferase-domain-containing protein [Lasiosphaeris hirsuta]|uniref:Methyltransferase-domain-containing protein n=1 Tax=Lasiosphaeris hirsuta TaxID=260670 RepID=A0AA40BBV8_9PEZI|nr:putative methyltransferase-domain-containing protein [Lasiosphaeris hirsuta]